MIFIVWIAFIPLELKTNFNCIKKYVKIKIFVDISEDTKILEFNQCQKSVKIPFITYAVFECLIEKTDGCENNPENLFTTEGNYSIGFFSVYNIII